MTNGRGPITQRGLFALTSQLSATAGIFAGATATQNKSEANTKVDDEIDSCVHLGNCIWAEMGDRVSRGWCARGRELRTASR